MSDASLAELLTPLEEILLSSQPLHPRFNYPLMLRLFPRLYSLLSEINNYLFFKYSFHRSSYNFIYYV